MRVTGDMWEIFGIFRPAPNTRDSVLHFHYAGINCDSVRSRELQELKFI